ncbi:MAG: hypothetical protein IPQ03_11735 [Bacteroidetes bacterium]|nr:hypothetical protein [Bacteroidota bacterium]
MIEIGKYNKLRVKSTSTIGMYLNDGETDILLPGKYVPEGTSTGDLLDVFVYLDNENRPIATTLKPFACVGDFAFLKVKDVNAHGAFLDWGIAKDVFVPYAEQRTGMVKGEKYLVYLLIDKVSERISATSKWAKHISKDPDYEEGDEVQLLIAEKTELGFKAIIDNRYEGLVFANEVFSPLEPGNSVRGFIKAVREDGKIDLRLQAKGYDAVQDAMNTIVESLKLNSGILSLGDKSTPEEIYKRLNMSKKIFKKAIGGLFKDQRINLSDFEIQLLENTEE